jgi:hypothetical protein
MQIHQEVAGKFGTPKYFDHDHLGIFVIIRFRTLWNRMRLMRLSRCDGPKPGIRYGDAPAASAAAPGPQGQRLGSLSRLMSLRLDPYPLERRSPARSSRR